VVTEEVFPVVLWSGKSDGRGEGRRENLHHAVSGERSSDAEHHIDGDQLALPEHQPRRNSPQDGIQHKQKGEIEDGMEE